MAEHTLDKPAEFLTSHQQRLSVTETEFFVSKNFYFKKGPGWSKNTKFLVIITQAFCLSHGQK